MAREDMTDLAQTDGIDIVEFWAIMAVLGAVVGTILGILA